jgi:hypothetical protein
MFSTKIEMKTCFKEISRRHFISRVLSALAISLWTAALLGMAGCASGKTASSISGVPPKPLRVLFIGNSYTYVNMLPEMLRQFSLARKQPRPLDYRMIAPGGCSLERHWQSGTAQKAIAEGGWDYVVLQDHSLGPITNSASMWRHARLFDREVRKVGGKTVFYSTWARKNAPASQSQITAAYSGIAAELGVLCCPAGPAWASVIHERPSLELYQSDGSHPSPAGTYLTACVFYSVLYGANPDGLPSTVVGNNQAGKLETLAALSEGDANWLRRTARRTVKEWAGGRRSPAQR